MARFISLIFLRIFAVTYASSKGYADLSACVVVEVYFEEAIFDLYGNISWLLVLALTIVHFIDLTYNYIFIIHHQIKK